MEEKSIVIYKNATYKIVESMSAWEFENDADYLMTIPMKLICISWQSPESGSVEGILVNTLPGDLENLKDSAEKMFEPCQINEVY